MTEEQQVPAGDGSLPFGVKEEVPPTVEEAMEALQKQMNQPSERQQIATSTPEKLAEAVGEINVADPATAKLLGQLQEQVAGLRNELTAVQAAGDGDVKEQGPAGYPWLYYKRSPEEMNSEGEKGKGKAAGWVTVGPGGPSPTTGRRDSGSFVKYMAKGFKPLASYGVCEPPSAYASGAAQFRLLLERGGAREFPATQILAYKWNVKPPIAGIKFPSLEEAVEGDRVRHFLCEDCNMELYMLDDDLDTGMECFRHLRKDTEDGRHGYPRAEATAMLMSHKIPFSAGRYAALAEQLKQVDMPDSGLNIAEQAAELAKA